jgi:hypothetical protein
MKYALFYTPQFVRLYKAFIFAYPEKKNKVDELIDRLSQSPLDTKFFHWVDSRVYGKIRSVK